MLPDGHLLKIPNKEESNLLWGGEQGGFSYFILPSIIRLLIKKITFLCHHFNDSQGASQHRHKSGNQLSERMRDFSSLNHKSMLSSL